MLTEQLMSRLGEIRALFPTLDSEDRRIELSAELSDIKCVALERLMDEFDDPVAREKWRIVVEYATTLKFYPSQGLMKAKEKRARDVTKAPRPSSAKSLNRFEFSRSISDL